MTSQSGSCFTILPSSKVYTRRECVHDRLSPFRIWLCQAHGLKSLKCYFEILSVSLFVPMSLKLPKWSLIMSLQNQWAIGPFFFVQNSIQQNKVLRLDEIFIILASITFILIKIIEFEIKTKVNFEKNTIFSFQIVKYCLIFKVFDTFPLCNLKIKHFLDLVKKRRVGERY